MPLTRAFTDPLTLTGQLTLTTTVSPAINITGTGSGGNAIQLPSNAYVGATGSGFRFNGSTNNYEVTGANFNVGGALLSGVSSGSNAYTLTTGQRIRMDSTSGDWLDGDGTNIRSNTNFIPVTDVASTLGTTSLRWSVIHGNVIHSYGGGMVIDTGTLSTANNPTIDFSGSTGAFKTTTGVTTIGGGEVLKYNAQSGTTYTAVSTDRIIGIANASAKTVTLPSASGIAGTCYTVKDTGGNASTVNVTVKSNGGTLDGVAAATGLVINTNFGKLNFFSDGTNWFTF